MSGVATQAYAQSIHDKCDASIFPEGWVQATIGGVTDLNPPKPPKDALPPDAPITFVPMPAVDAYSGTITVPEDRPFGAVRKGYTSFRDNDVIFAKITPCMENGKAAIARDLTNGLGFGSTEFHVLRSNGAAIPDYLFHYIRQESFRGAAEAAMTGSVGQKRVPVDFLKNALLPLPPLSEQKRIMAKVEQLLTRVNAARECLVKVPEILKRFRQSVLAAACSGRLTADWRDTHQEIKPASKLLEQIISRSPQRRSARLTNGVRINDDLPETWTHCRLGLLSKLITKGASPKWQGIDYASKGILFITSENVRSGYLNLENRKYVEKRFNAIQKRSILEKGDLLTNIVGASIGRTAIFDLDDVANINQAVALIRLCSDVDKRYILNVLNAPMILDFMNENKVDVARANLSLKDVLNFPVPLPPMAEQREIVHRTEGLFQIAAQIEARYERATAYVEKLTQSILAKAFRGELVPTEAELARCGGRSYEPASALLAKIEAQRKDVKPQRKSGGSWQHRDKQPL